MVENALNPLCPAEILGPSLWSRQSSCIILCFHKELPIIFFLCVYIIVGEKKLSMVLKHAVLIVYYHSFNIILHWLVLVFCVFAVYYGKYLLLSGTSQQTLSKNSWVSIYCREQKHFRYVLLIWMRGFKSFSVCCVSVEVVSVSTHFLLIGAESHVQVSFKPAGV